MSLSLQTNCLTNFAFGVLRYTPITAVGGSDGLILDVTGCAHLWGSEEAYLKEIINKLKGFGYHVRAAMADTIGTAWAISRYGKIKAIIKAGEQAEAIMAYLLLH